MESIYRSILKQAVNIAWKFKYLWFFGLFAALAGNGGIYNIGINNFDKVESQGIFLNDLKEGLKNLQFRLFNWEGIWTNISFWEVILLVVILAVVVFLIWLSFSSQGALVWGIRQALGGKNHLFREALSVGKSKFWPILGLNILLNIVILILLLLVSLPFIIIFLSVTESVVLKNILIVLAFIVWVPIAIILSFILQYAIIYLVNENNKAKEAIKNAWVLFKKHWLVSLEMALLLFVVNLLLSLGLVVALIFVSLPFVVLAMIAGYLASASFFWLVMILGLIVFIILMFWFGALLNIFQTASWVILFERLKNGNVYSKTLRWAVKLTGKKEESNP